MKSPDGLPIRLFFCLVACESSRPAYLHILATVAKVARDSYWRRYLERARDRTQIFDALIEGEKALCRVTKVAVIGGGTGISPCLSGIKHVTDHITAIVTVADDGGSSGRLRKDYDMLPPGDIRNCLVALSSAEPLLTDLFSYRFDDALLRGHSFGNLFLAVLTKLTGDFRQAIERARTILDVRGVVIPSTTAARRARRRARRRDEVDRRAADLDQPEGDPRRSRSGPRRLRSRRRSARRSKTPTSS